MCKEVALGTILAHKVSSPWRLRARALKCRRHFFYDEELLASIKEIKKPLK